MAFSEKKYLKKLRSELRKRGVSDEVLSDVKETFVSASERGESAEEVAERLGTPAEFADNFGKKRVRNRFFAGAAAISFVVGAVLFAVMSFAGKVPDNAIGYAEGGTDIFVSGSGAVGIILRVLLFVPGAVFAVTDAVLNRSGRKSKHEKV